MDGVAPSGVLVEALEQIASAMDAIVAEGSGSAAAYRHGWIASGLFVGDGPRLIACGRRSHPFLVEAAGLALSSLLNGREGPVGQIAHGDVWVTNDPRASGAGPRALVAVRPIFHDGAAFGYAVSAAGHPDAAPGEGGSASGGAVVPWMRAARADGAARAVMDLLRANSPVGLDLADELLVQARSLEVGSDGMEALLRGERPALVRDHLRRAEAQCRDAMMRILAALGSETHRGYAGPVAATARLDDGRLSCEFHVGPGDGDSPLLARPAATATARAGLRQALIPEVPGILHFGGWEEILAVSVAQAAGPLAPSRAPASEDELAQAAIDAVIGALAGGLPHLSKAPGPAGPLGLNIRGRDGAGRPYALDLLLAGGAGATVWGDALTHAAPLMAPGRQLPVEELERISPLRVRGFAVREGSAGPGQYRGGLGCRVAIEVAAGEAHILATLPGAAPGARGGMRGAAGRLALHGARRGIREWEGPARITLDVAAGDRLIVETPGGGGWGIPYQRSIMRVEEDLRLGLLDRDQAKRGYGVIFPPHAFEKDDLLTYRVRRYLLGMLTVEDILAGEELLD